MPVILFHPIPEIVDAMSHVLTKSAKGLREASGKTQDLPERLRDVLKMCRGQFVAEELVDSVAEGSRADVASALLELTEEGYLRAVMEIPGDAAAAGASDAAAGMSDEDAQSTDVAAQHLRAEFAARRGQRDDEASEQVRQAEAAARQRAAERAQQLAEERAREEAIERARREAEARARIEAEEKARLETLERERAEAEEKARREAAERTRRAAEEKAKKEAAERARRDAEERARRDAEERELMEMRERIRQRGIKRRRIVVPIVIALIVVPAMLYWGVGMIPMEGKRKAFEARASEMLGVSVTIGTARFVPLPKPQWQLDDVTAGDGASRVTATRIDVMVPVSGLWSLPPQFGDVHIDSPVVPVAALPGIFADDPPAGPLAVGEIGGTGLVIMGKTPVSPPMSFSGTADRGRFATITAQGQSVEAGKFALNAQRGVAGWQVEFQASQCTVPFGFDLALTDCVLRARFAGTTMHVGSFAARSNNGDVVATGNVSWAGPWQSSGSIELRRLDVSMMAPAWFKDGMVTGSAEFTTSAGQPGELFAGLQAAGKFSIAPGTLNHIDLDRVVQGRGIGEQFRFESLDGSVLFANKRASFAGIALVSGPLRAEGALEVEANQSLGGRIAVEVKTGAMRIVTPVRVSGTLAKPQYEK